jgi:hypothetical protein
MQPKLLGAWTNLKLRKGHDGPQDRGTCRLGSLQVCQLIMEESMESSQRPGWMLKLVGITALSMAACSHVVSIATDEFSTTEGTITASYVSPTSGLDKPIVLDELGNQCIDPATPTYTRVLYRYKVDGTTYHREIQTETSTNRKAGDVAGVYCPGQRLTVFYKPADPYQSHIWPELPQSEVFLAALGIATYLIALLCGRFEFLSRLFDVSFAIEANELEVPAPKPRFSFDNFARSMGEV